MRLEDLLAIRELFVAQGWPIHDETDSPYPLLFTRFCQMCDRLTEEQRSLVIQISHEYQWLKRHDEDARFLRAWRMFLASLSTGVRKIIVLPLNFWDKGNSAFSVYYMAKSLGQAMRIGAGNRSIVFSAAGGTRAANSVLVGIDDYVGSGTTAIDALGRLRQRRPAQVAFHVVALAAQEGAIRTLAAAGVPVFADVSLRRGISDCPSIRDQARAFATMDSIEAMLHIAKDMRRGYEQTEALVSLQRTPNNTFPVFWTERRVKTRPWNPPFGRNTE